MLFINGEEGWNIKVEGTDNCLNYYLECKHQNTL